MDISLHCCDIHPQAVAFLQKEIGVNALLSAREPEKLVLPMPFDVVFALSFFSHMPGTTWARWLVRLSEAVKPGGILLFTTHGLASRQYLGNPAIPPDGFWFASVSEQKDLPTEDYDSAIVTPEFVKRTMATIPSLDLLTVQEAYWWGHQDLYGGRKRSTPLIEYLAPADISFEDRNGTDTRGEIEAAFSLT